MSGEIIQLSNVMSLIFECRDLSQASVSHKCRLKFSSNLGCSASQFYRSNKSGLQEVSRFSYTSFDSNSLIFGEPALPRWYKCCRLVIGEQPKST